MFLRTFIGPGKVLESIIEDNMYQRRKNIITERILIEKFEMIGLFDENFCNFIYSFSRLTQKVPYSSSLLFPTSFFPPMFAKIENSFLASEISFSVNDFGIPSR